MLGGIGQLSEAGELGAGQSFPARGRNAVATFPCVNSVGVFTDGAGQCRRSTSVSDDVGKGPHGYELYKTYRSNARQICRQHTGKISYVSYMEDEIKARASRLRQARVQAGVKSAAEAVRQHRFQKNSYPSHENGNAPFSFAKAQEYARAYGVNAEWLYSGAGDADDSVTSETVPVVGYVSAGAELALFDQGQGPFDYVLPPRDSKPTTVAARVQGTSLGPLFDEAIIFYDSVQSPITPALHGKLCVAGLEDGRVVVKQIMPGDGGRYHLLSNSAEPPIFNAELVWAARVTDLRPR